MSISAVKRAGHRQVAHRDRLRERLRAEDACPCAITVRLTHQQRAVPGAGPSASSRRLHARGCAGGKVGQAAGTACLGPDPGSAIPPFMRRAAARCDGNGLRHAWRGCLDVSAFLRRVDQHGELLWPSTAGRAAAIPWLDFDRRSDKASTNDGRCRPKGQAAAEAAVIDRVLKGTPMGSPSPPPLAEVIHTPGHPAACVSCKAGTPSSSRHTVYARLRQGAPNSLAATHAWRSMQRVPVAPERDAALQVPPLQGARPRRLCLGDDCCYGKAEHQHCWAPRWRPNWREARRHARRAAAPDAVHPDRYPCRQAVRRGGERRALTEVAGEPSDGLGGLPDLSRQPGPPGPDVRPALIAEWFPVSSNFRGCRVRSKAQVTAVAVILRKRQTERRKKKHPTTATARKCGQTMSMPAPR